jgi:hypothetical protein
MFNQSHRTSPPVLFFLNAFKVNFFVIAACFSKNYHSLRLAQHLADLIFGRGFRVDRQKLNTRDK